jgi:hypothetical protein
VGVPLDMHGRGPTDTPCAAALFNELNVDISRKARDDMGESEWEYGPRAGLPRLLKMFNK